MKSLILFLVILQGCLPKVFSQKYESSFDMRAIYKLTCQTDSLDPGSVQTSTWYLFISNNESLFQEKNLVNADSVAYFHPEVDAALPKRSGVPMSPVDKNRYKIIKTKDSITVYDEVVGRDIYGKIILFAYKEPKPVLSWQLGKDTVEIEGQLCQLAYTTYGGRNWVAYFSPGIPIDEGPYKFSGLPGLIMRVHDDQKYWEFQLMDFSKLQNKKSIVINFQDTYVFKQGDKSEFFRMRKDFQNNIIPMMESAGAKFDDIMKVRLETKMKKDNNWIELYP